MKKTKLFGYAMTGVLSIGIIGGGVHAFAATTSSSTPVYEKHMLDEATKQKVQGIMEELKTNLASLGVTFPEKGDKFSRLLANLDENTKAKAQAIFEKQKAGEITREQARQQLEALGISFPKKGDKLNELLTNLDENTKAKAQELIEEAKEKLAELGVDHLPHRGF
ncbi:MULTISPECIES: hypothetical protein [unclassified Anoxybacillus]|uniref:hypothetical protein n=1 Tax=unclassified Anoxybacillus TaxID=2639704 RepID=UPI001EDAAFCC|nr:MULTISPECIES: hypothetical protein [unclassified Anoxybacillus]MCG3085403.1 hypothetical protein [Anoxybacillus sp. LAT27]MCG6184757.1 hypothetical protein [Anoxybacillus sp. LAT_26]MCG6199482.1 hypothetical protein [Anoxybacillus sp. LAT_38]